MTGARTCLNYKRLPPFPADRHPPRAIAQYTDGLSPYQFVASNPITGQDPTGLFTFLDLSMTTALQGQLIGMQGDLGASTVDAMKGIVLWGMERNAAIDRMLGQATDGWDAHRSSVDSIFNAVGFYQDVQAVSFGVAAGMGAFKVAALGKNLWRKYISRAGGRPGLLKRRIEPIVPEPNRYPARLVTDFEHARRYF